MEPAAAHESRSDVEFIDVREDDEWTAGHIDGARHVPLDNLGAALDTFDPAERFVTVCRSGVRSAKAVELLSARGLRADNLDGGMQAWFEAGLPLRSSDDEPPRVA